MYLFLSQLLSFILFILRNLKLFLVVKHRSAKTSFLGNFEEHCYHSKEIKRLESELSGFVK